MKILLIQPKTNWGHPYCESPSVALLTLGAIAKQYGHEVTVKHLDIDLFDPTKSLEYGLIGITCNTFQVKSARETIQGIRKYNSKSKIVLGGPHAIAWDNQKDGQVDKVVVGEGENAWLSILGANRQYESIDEIPLPDYSFVDMSRFSGVAPMGAVPSMVLFGSRGCPGKCIFCNTPVFWGSKARYRNPKSIVDQIAMLHHDYGMQEVFIQDDTFNANWPWAKEILERIIARGLHKKMVFRIDCRANEVLLTEAFLKLAAKAGVWNIFLGIESASQAMLDRMRKHITVEEYRRAIRLIQQYGMKVQASFIIGLPGETWETIAETQRFIDETHPFMIGAGYATPFPGTEFDKYVTEHGQKKIVDYGDYIYGQILTRTDELSHEDLASFRGYQNVPIEKLN
jgi:radical SAM superfamily enzyme YgiQ (UPF0313 family)